MDTSSTGSTSGTSSDSWLFVTKNLNKNADDDDQSGTAGNRPENIKSSDEMEDSDGISVISESEMKIHTNSDGEQEKPQIPEEIEEEDEEFEGEDETKNNNKEQQLDENLLTPPSTPNEINEEEEQNQERALKKYEENALKEVESNDGNTSSSCHKSNHAALLLISMSLIIALLYTNVSSLKNELSRTISVYEQRITRLEQENQILKTQLDELMKKLGSDAYTTEKSLPTPTPEKFQGQQHQRVIADDEIHYKPPVTKDVWLGGEKEDVVKVLDKKYNSLPDYCYFTDENDLFYEYNMENCEKKKQKMEERMKKLNDKRDKFEKKENQDVNNNNNNKFSVDDIWKSNDKMYNDFMSKTADELLQSLNDEIEDIKNSRFAAADPMTNKQYVKDDDKENINIKYDNNKKPFTKDDKQKAQYAGTNYEGSADNKKRKDKKANNFEDDKSYSKQQKRPRRKDGSGNWVDQRTKGREDARMHKDSEENWYLKRKNDREIHRLEKTIRN